MVLLCGAGATTAWLYLAGHHDIISNGFSLVGILVDNHRSHLLIRWLRELQPHLQIASAKELDAPSTMASASLEFEWTITGHMLIKVKMDHSGDSRCGARMMVSVVRVLYKCV